MPSPIIINDSDAAVTIAFVWTLRSMQVISVYAAGVAAEEYDGT